MDPTAQEGTNDRSSTKPQSTQKNAYKDQDDGKQRFLQELEFIQCLANPTYIHHEADVKEGDVVLEIGPDIGSLTNTLLNSGATVLAVEKEPAEAVVAALSSLPEEVVGTVGTTLPSEDSVSERIRNWSSSSYNKFCL